LLLGVRFAQADGVLTWGGAKVVKSVSGYDVPKLMVGALGTLGVLLELTLRLHPAPDHEATWLASFRTPAHAQDCVAALLDSTVQTNRLEVLDGRVLAACSLPVSAAALAISIATVEPAVRAQEGLVKAIVQRAPGAVQTMGASFWKTYDRALAGFDGVTLRIGTVPARLVETLGAVQAVLPGAAVAGAAGLGALRALVTHADVSVLLPPLERLRATVGEVGGGVTVERAPRALRERLDPWGPVPAPALAVMRAIKTEFDPRGVLNPGRFVGTARAEIERGGRRPRRRRLLEASIFGVFPHPHRLAIVLGLLRRYRRWGLQALVRRSGLLRRIPPLAAMDALLHDIPRTD